MTDPLNPTLYSLLKQKFGEVKIANEGCPAYYQRMPDPLNPRRTIMRASSWGEYYCVRCPFCRDHSPRLWVNHLYASEVNYGRRQFTHMAVCYNNQCLKEPGRTEQFEQMLFGVGAHLKPRALAVKPVTTMFEPKPVSPPGEIVPLSDLPSNHAARQYIESRGFDPDWLAMKFQIGVVASASEPKFDVMRGRLYIPVTYRNELVGWQCRAIAPSNAPKYLNAPNMRKANLLYNYDSAESQPFVVVVEGVTSVWRIGQAAVCLFGKSMSMMQQNMIAKAWAGKPVFLILDNDAKIEMEHARHLLAQHSLQVVTIELPDARDPAEYSASAITDLLLERATAAGVLKALT